MFRVRALRQKQKRFGKIPFAITPISVPFGQVEFGIDVSGICCAPYKLDTTLMVLCHPLSV